MTPSFSLATSFPPLHHAVVAQRGGGPPQALSSFRNLSHKNSMQGLKELFFIFYRVSAIATTALMCSNLVFAENIDELRVKAEQGDANSQFKLARCYADNEGFSEVEIAANLRSVWIAKNLYVESNHEVNFFRKKLEAAEWYRKAAEQGHAKAQFHLGEWLENIDQTEAVEWYRKAGLQGNAEAQFALGRCYYRGSGVTKDYAEALKWARKAAEQGHAEAQRIVGDFYAHGLSVPKNLKEAFKWYHKAADLESARAQSILGNFYEYGLANAIDKKEAVKWYQKSANQGYAHAQFCLGVCYINGEGVLKDQAEALKWFRKAADQEHADAQFKLSQLSKDRGEAWEWQKKAAENGNADAQFEIGYAYFIGKMQSEEGQGEAEMWWRKAAKNGHSKAQLYVGFYSKDQVEAANWYRKAADQGYADAQFKLGNCYAAGSGVVKNQSEAVNWYRKAAEQGVANAQFSLAVCYYQGNGISKNESEAAKWFRKAAEKGHSAAQKNLGFCYENGKGVPKDTVAAASWYNKAKGDETKNETLYNTPKEKFALLIANSKYSQFGGLANTDSDAQKLAKVLNSLGFQVSILKNASKEQMLDALKDFEAKVRGTNAIAFFHYGGHGVQVEGKNYLIPADAEIPDERRVSTRAVDLDEVIAVLDSAKPKASVLVVDACRHNPLPATATRSATRGLAVVGRKPKNSVIIYAAEAGNEAFDGLFTPILAENLQEHSDKSLNQIMQKVRAEVFERSKGAQTPGEYNQLFEDLFFSKN
jgi:TPR repeat protein